MAYAEAEDLRGTLPTDWTDELVEDGDGGNVSNLDTALKDASDWVDGFLSRFGPPISLAAGNGTQVTLDVLRVHTVVRAKHVLLGRKVGPEGYRNPDEDFKATRDYLTAIQKGASLPGGIEPAPPTTPTAAVSGSVMGGEIVFDDDSAVL